MSDADDVRDLAAQIKAHPAFLATQPKAEAAARRISDRSRDKLDAMEEREVTRHHVAMRKIGDARRAAHNAALDAYHAVERAAWAKVETLIKKEAAQ